MINLTLTRVVFECRKSYNIVSHISNLTLTRVVFEYAIDGLDILFLFKFNFNKSCIWIDFIFRDKILKENLTLTRVVFECIFLYVCFYISKNLTLTRVVFE